jgi:hypothetical protein
MKILAFRNKISAVSNYRLTRPLTLLGATFRKTLLRKNDKLTLQQLGERLKKIGDIWVMKYVDDFNTLNVIYSMRNAVKSKVVVDIDDNLWAMEPDNASFGSPKAHANRCMMVMESIRSADWVTVSTKPLWEYLKKYNENITVLPNLIDPSEWKWKRETHDKIRIGWVYSPTHFPDIKGVLPYIKKLHRDFGDRIEFVVFGTTCDIFGKVPITKIKGVAHADYPKMLTEAGIDISIAPLKHNDFNRSKSNIKWLESTLSGACFVCSDLDPYNEVINGKTGFKVKKDWYKPIARLIEDKELRETLQRNSLEAIKKYDINTNKDYKIFYECIS